MTNKQKTLGQYFTKPEIVNRLLDLLFEYKNYKKDISILEPSFGTGNFITDLNNRKYFNITGCEIDPALTNNSSDFFETPLEKKYDLIVGNPPFSKYNLKESYFSIANYLQSKVWPASYLTKTELAKGKERIENTFVLKSLQHLKNNDSSVGFVLPISFFIKNKNKSVKNELVARFSTIIIYQNNKTWFDRNIPCCFALFTNIKKLENKIILIYENGCRNEEVFDLNNIHEELIPQVVFHKNRI